MGNVFSNLFGINPQDVQAQVDQAGQQLQQAFTILIIEGALAVLFLGLIYTRLKH